MPHLKLEYSGNLTVDFDFESLFFNLHKVLNEVTGINPENCKSRAVPLKNYYIGDGHTGNAFVHLDVSILEGRQNDLVQITGQKLLKLLVEFFSNQPEIVQTQFTIEIRDMKRDHYFKQIASLSKA